MELELAVAAVCAPRSCRVRLLDSQTVVEACYSDPVQDRIKVRPGDLVAIDRSLQPPAVVWRWWHGTVERVDGDRAVVARNITQREPEDARRGLQQAGMAPDLSGQIQAGDTVFFFGHEQPLIVDVARSGFPIHAERIRGDYFPEIAAAYARMASA